MTPANFFLTVFMSLTTALPAAADSPASTATAEGDRLARGIAIIEQIEPGTVANVRHALEPLAPGWADQIFASAFGDIYTRPHLTLRERQLITVAALATQGNAAPQLRLHLSGALKQGVRPETLAELMVHLSIYNGVPNGINGLMALRTVLEASAPAPADDE